MRTAVDASAVISKAAWRAARSAARCSLRVGIRTDDFGCAAARATAPAATAAPAQNAPALAQLPFVSRSCAPAEVGWRKRTGSATVAVVGPITVATSSFAQPQSF